MADDGAPAAIWTPASDGPPESEADWRAFGAAYLPLFWGIARGKYALPWDEAEEVVSRAWLLVFQKRDGMPGGAARGRWLASVLCWKCRDVIRERTDGQPLPSGVPAPGAPPPEDVLILLERRELLMDALAGMPQRARTLIEGRYFEEPPRSYAALGRLTGLKEDSVGPTLYRGLLELGERLQGRGIE